MAGMGDFDYSLPDAAIAQTPVEPRDAARLLDATGGAVEHRRVCDLAELLEPGDLVVVNETRVLPARLRLRKPTGGAVEILLLEAVDGARLEWDALVRPGRRVPPGTILLAGDDEVVEVGEATSAGRRRVRLRASTVPAAVGTIPLPPYIHKPLADPERYQTVFARREGSVAAPTAGLHLTPSLLERIRDRGIGIASVDLEVGLDTFRPVTVERAEDHVIHSEFFSVPAETLDACARAARVVAIGTTVVRALESAARGDRSGRTSLFVRAPFEFRVVDVLLTNFHLPRSSLLLLLDAFVGPRWRDLYDIALNDGYRFLSFGDAMLVDRSA